MIDGTDSQGQQRILSGQLQVFFDRAQLAIFIQTALGMVVAILLYHRGTQWVPLAGWGGSLLLVALANLALCRRFRSDAAGAEHVRVWSCCGVALSLVSGGLFGLLPIVFLDPTRFEDLAWSLLILVGLAGGAVGTLSAYAPAFQALVAAATGPLLIALIVPAHAHLLVVAVVCGAAVIGFVGLSRRIEATLVQRIRGDGREFDQ